MKFTQAITTKLDDDAAERVHRNTDLQIRELQGLPTARAVLVTGVVLLVGAVTLVPHGLGRAPSYVGPSAIRGASTAGVIQDFESTDGAGNPVDRAKFVPLRALSFGATITVDLLVM